ASAGRERWVLDASTSYIVSLDAAAEIRQFSPDARILVILRNPVDMMHSWHRWLVAVGFEQIFDFEEALAAEPDRCAGSRLPRSQRGLRENLRYRYAATFSPQVERYFRDF